MDTNKTDKIYTSSDGSFTYTIVRSSRRTVGYVVNAAGEVQVRIPRRFPLSEAIAMTEDKRDWIRKALEKVRERREQSRSRDWPAMRDATYAWIRAGGRRMLRDKLDYWAQRMGVTYQRIAIRDTSTRWGSCSSKGNLNFCWKIFLLPEHLADYLVVHELAHRVHMDHSAAFWAMVRQYCPYYESARRELKYY